MGDCHSYSDKTESSLLSVFSLTFLVSGWRFWFLPAQNHKPIIGNQELKT